MVAMQILSTHIQTQKDSGTVIKNNWRQLYRRDSQYTYPEATLVLPKNRKN